MLLFRYNMKFWSGCINENISHITSALLWLYSVIYYNNHTVTMTSRNHSFVKKKFLYSR